MKRVSLWDTRRNSFSPLSLKPVKSSMIV